MHDIEKLWACYRASYPDATDEQIHYWINGTPGEDEADHVAPPLLKNGYTGWELAARARAGRGEDLMQAG